MTTIDVVHSSLVVRRSLWVALELAMPTTCGGCGAPGATWCSECAHETAQVTYPGGPVQVCPTPCPLGYPPTWAATPYESAARAALVAFKDGDRRDLGAVLSQMLSLSLAAALATDWRLGHLLASGNGPVFVVPVPSSRSAIRRRGDAPLELLTRAAVAQTARSAREVIVSPALRLRRRVADQAGLDHRQRAANLEHAMQVHPRWRKSVQGATCVLTDDVLTTGATLGEAARALLAGGAVHVAAATIAATQRRGIPAGKGG
jgi:predicted amidophosphoribosyltransferase